MIISQSFGAFRLCAVPITLNKIPIQQGLMRVDEYIREHPYFQKSCETISLYFSHVADYQQLLESKCFVGREVIGSPLYSEHGESFCVIDAPALKCFESKLTGLPFLGYKEIFEYYHAFKSEVGPQELGSMWRLEYREADPDVAMLHLLPSEQKLFSQFNDY